MDSELAQRLKKAGYPQGGKGVWFYGTEVYTQAELDAYRLRFHIIPDVIAYVPTTDELLAQFKYMSADGFLDLSRRSYREKPWSASCSWELGTGYTPEQAMGELWIKLKYPPVLTIGTAITSDTWKPF